MRTLGAPSMGLAGAVWICAACDLPSGGRFPQQGVESVEDAAPTAQTVPAQDLRLTVGTERPDFELGEPIYAMIILENVGDRARRVVGELRPEDGAITILIAGGDRETRAFSPLAHADNDQTALVELGPGERIGATAPIFFGSNGWTFAEPGEYELSAVYAGPGEGGSIQQVRSEPIVISVHGDEGAGAVLTAGDSASFEAGKFLTWQAGDHLVDGRELLEAVIERWPNSRHASHAAFALGRSWSEPFMDYGRNEVRPSDCELALEFLNRVDRSVVGTQANVLIHVARARCAALTDDRQAALTELERGRELAADRPELARLRARLDEYSQNLRTSEQSGAAR